MMLSTTEETVYPIPQTALQIYRLRYPGSDCEYPFLAAPRDRSVLLSLGDHGLCFEFALPPETERWLSEDFTPTGEIVPLDLLSLRYVLDRTYSGGIDFGILHFDDGLRLLNIELSPCARDMVDEGPEYQVRAFGDYERVLRDSEQRRSVTLAERAVLDVCCATFAPLTASMPHLLATPPPRYWQLSTL